MTRRRGGSAFPLRGHGERRWDKGGGEQSSA
jgi:hypothetical protein